MEAFLVETDTLERIIETGEIVHNIIAAEVAGEIAPEQSRELLAQMQEAE